VYKKLNSTGTLIQKTTTEAPRGHMYYIGLDVHKKTISYCVPEAGLCQIFVVTKPSESPERSTTRSHL
jgi:hypothetical protein